ncbi:non-ribosomal peptide synthetase/MFS transporter [Nonomuraea ceibae]|uniref:non-ribosomal peptide synthetase/MFS transporter n=1 Tax=Nonomuraea ceibae TaxID=1935170 RepID=UPI001C6020EB|nr:non-ribosomal peptide synthetase/MFS transporter [Nonomuraea ceibae]
MTTLDDGLSPAKQAVLSGLLRRRAAASSVPRRPEGRTPPLSHAQERLWFMEQYAPGTAAYTVPLGTRLSGDLDAEALARALREVAARHESLRTRFVTDGEGRPAVVIEDEPAVEFTVAESDEAGAAELCAAQLARPFDLASGPLLRALLVRLGPEEHVLLLTAHHAVIDGWSYDLVLSEALTLHDAFRAGEPSPLEEPPVQYGDYALWQRAQEERQQEPAYWTRRLSGVPALDLPSDWPRPAEQTFAGAGLRFKVGQETAGRVADLARGRGASLYMTLLAAFQVLLFRHSGQRDFAVGSPVSGRETPELERTVGVFVNTLAMRADLSGDPPFTELLDRVRDATLDDFAHQGLPFDRLVGELNVKRDVSRSPVFQVMFALQNFQAPARWATGLRMAEYRVDAATTRFDLTLYLRQTGDGLDGHIVYNTALFLPETMECLAARFVALLAAVAAEPSTRISELNLLDAAERAEVLAFGTVPSLPRPERRLLHELTGGHPSATAVACGDTTLTYGELERRANRLARFLRRRGVGRDTRVAVCMEQSADVAVAVLGVLKAGGAYVPLDPEHPAGRLAHAVSDSGALAAVVTEGTRDRLPPGLPTFTLDDTDVEEDGPVDADVRPGDLAYVIYTSGTTGTPKGVAVQHREAVTYLLGVRERLGVVQGGVFVLLQSLAFDFGVTVFYLSLATGGTLHLVPARTSAPELAKTLAGIGPDYMKITPSHLAALLADAPAAELLPKRLLILGGEAAGQALADEVVAAGRCAVVNHYGPTEATVGMTTYAVDPAGAHGGATLPIGRPLPGAVVRVLDEHLRPVGVGVPGEIHLGGDRLARGYLGRPGLTADRFVPDPYGPPGARLYRTGDLGRWLPDGNLQFLGRTDHQVKIRGYRVELGEIESVLTTLPGVSQAVAELRSDRLVAYLAGPEAGPRPGAADLREALRALLPDYMIPSRYVWLDTLPLKAHGKVDRDALPEPGLDRETEWEPPATPTEQAVAAVWSAVLGVDEVGAADDFFDLGGHSLLAMQVVARLRAVAPGRLVTIMDLFRHPTVRELAGLLERGEDGPRVLLHRLTPARQATGTIVCAPYGGGSAVIYKPLADALSARWALYSIAVPGHELGEESRPLDEVAAACAEEILAKVAGPLVLYGHCGLGVMLTVEIARRLEAAGREVDAVYLGGTFPFARTRWTGVTEALERLRSDQLWANALRAAGLEVDELGRDQLKLVIDNRRKGTREAERYFTRLFEQDGRPLRVPIISVVGERDPATEFYQERFREWHLLSATTAVAVLDEAGHFFLRYRAAELAEIVTRTHVALAEAEPDRLGRTETSTWWLQDASTADDPPPEHRGPRPSMRRFGVIAAGQLVSMIGAALTEFAIPIWIYTTTGSLVSFALLAVLGLVPGILIAPLAGVVVDRFDRRRVLLAADAAALSTQLIFGALLWTGGLTTWHVYPLLACLSVALTFQRLAYTSAIPQLVPKRFLGHANGVVQMATGSAQLVVPLVAAGLMAAIGVEGILAIDVASYVVAIAAVIVTRFPRTMAATRREPIVTEMLNGLRYSWGNRGFRGMLGFFAVLNVFLSPLFLIISPLVLAFAGLPDVAQVSFAGGLGTLAGGLAMAVWGGPRRRRLRGVLLATLALSLACLVTGLHANVQTIAVGAFGMSLCLTLVNGVYATIIQVKVPQRYHGRVIALNTLVAWSTLPIGFGLVAPYGAALFEPLLAPGGPLAGTVGAVIGVGAGRGIGFMYVCFAAAIAVIALAAMRVRVLARFDEIVPDAVPDDLIGYETVAARRRT